MIRASFRQFREVATSRKKRLLSLAVAVTVAAAGLASAPPASATTDIAGELQCLALNIYFEARGEPDEGMRAVGHVVMNRVLHPRFPRSVCQVVRQGGERRRYRCQFSWWCDGRSDRPRDRGAWQESRMLAYQIYVGISRDPTDGALWYHADYVRPEWGKYLKRGPKIGQHIFYQKDIALRQFERRAAAARKAAKRAAILASY